MLQNMYKFTRVATIPENRKKALVCAHLWFEKAEGLDEGKKTDVDC